MAADPLDGLAPLRWPPIPWPDVSETLMLTGLGGLAVGLAIAALLGLFGATGRRPSARRVALAGIDGAAGASPEEKLATVAMILRTYAAKAGDPVLSKAEGRDWLVGLDAVFRTDFFTVGAGRVLVEGLYRPQRREDVEAVTEGVRRLLKARWR